MMELSPRRSQDDTRHDPASEATRTLVRAFQRVTSTMYASADLNQTLQVIADGVIQLVGFKSAVVGVALEDGGFKYVAFNGPPEVRRAMSGATMSREQWDWRISNCVRWGSLCWIDHRVVWPESMTAWIPNQDLVGAEDGDADAWDAEDFLFAPLLGPNGDVLGVLSVDLPSDGRKPDAARLELLELFAESAAMAVWHSMLLDELHREHRLSRHMATHDPLTGVANRTALLDAAAALVTAETGLVGALVIDLDHFKDINDVFGHAAGDEVLIVVARRMARVLRDHDVLARTGGDEFVAVVGGLATRSQIDPVVERLHAAVTLPIKGAAGTYRVGASIGVSTMPAPVVLAELLQAADAEMYRVKHAVRTPVGQQLRLAT